jgi:hypothetical protein
MDAQARSCAMFPVHGSPQEQETFIARYINIIIKVRTIRDEFEKNKARTKKFDGIVQAYVPRPVKADVRCQAVNLNNTPCKFKATCGKFCKKHKVTVEMLEMLE